MRETVNEACARQPHKKKELEILHLQKMGNNWKITEKRAVGDGKTKRTGVSMRSGTGNDGESARGGKGGGSSNPLDGNRGKWREKGERTGKNIIYRRYF